MADPKSDAPLIFGVGCWALFPQSNQLGVAHNQCPRCSYVRICRTRRSQDGGVAWQQASRHLKDAWPTSSASQHAEAWLVREATCTSRHKPNGLSNRLRYGTRATLTQHYSAHNKIRTRQGRKRTNGGRRVQLKR